MLDDLQRRVVKFRSLAEAIDLEIRYPQNISPQVG